MGRRAIENKKEVLPGGKSFTWKGEKKINKVYRGALVTFLSVALTVSASYAKSPMGKKRVYDL
jgi:hypothetical protein